MKYVIAQEYYDSLERMMQDPTRVRVKMDPDGTCTPYVYDPVYRPVAHLIPGAWRCFYHTWYTAAEKIHILQSLEEILFKQATELY